jgi:hypothetical protein
MLDSEDKGGRSEHERERGWGGRSKYGGERRAVEASIKRNRAFMSPVNHWERRGPHGACVGYPAKGRRKNYVRRIEYLLCFSRDTAPTS